MRGDMSSKIISVFPKFPLEVAQERSQFNL